MESHVHCIYMYMYVHVHVQGYTMLMRPNRSKQSDQSDCPWFALKMSHLHKICIYK